MKLFKLSVVTPDGEVFNGEAESLLVHAEEGDLEILAGHVDFVASIGTGRARIRTESGTMLAACSGGFLNVSKEKVSLVCVTFELADNIDLGRAIKAKEIAESRISEAKDERSLDLAKAKLARALCRIKVAEDN